MAKRDTILKRLGPLVPDVDAIAIAYGVDRKRAKKIALGMASLLEFVGDLITEQAELIEGQADTAKLIEREFGRERDAKTILSNIEVFLVGDTASVQYVLDSVFLPIFAEAFGKLSDGRQRELFVSLREAVNSLKRQDNLLVDP